MFFSLPDLWREYQFQFRQESAVQSAMKLVSLLPPFLQIHSHNVAIYMLYILDPPPSDSLSIYVAGLLHDVGKLRISPDILSVPRKLTKEEFAEIKKHPIYGKQLVKTLFLPKEMESLSVQCVAYHHERVDGRGYPYGFEQLPEISRACSVADTFDAITACRPYAAARSFDEGAVELVRSAGLQLDANMVQRFCFQIPMINRKKYRIVF